MAEYTQAAFARAARGASVGRGADIEPVVKGISSIARAAVRRVHKESPDKARTYFLSKSARFRLMGGRPAATAQTYGSSFERYVGWEPDGQPAVLDVAASVPFAEGDLIRARAHVVVGSEGERDARVLLWDDVALDERAAQMIALPVFECVAGRFGDGATATVSVWQLARGERVTVAPQEAEARRDDVDALLTEMGEG